MSRRASRLRVLPLLTGLAGALALAAVSAGPSSGTPASGDAPREQAGRVHLLSHGKWDGVVSIDLSNNGRWATYYDNAGHDVFFRDRHSNRSKRLASQLKNWPADPVISGNGRYVVYVGSRRAGDPPIGSVSAKFRAVTPLVRWDRKTGKRQEIALYPQYDESNRGYAISDDGDSIALLRAKDGKANGAPEIVLWQAGSDTMTTVADLDYDAYYQGIDMGISGDGSKVAYTAEVDGQCSTLLWDADTATTQTVAAKSLCQSLVGAAPAPTLSHSGDLVTWPGERRNSDHAMVDATYLWSAATGKSQRTKDLGAVTDDGAAIVFPSNGRIGRQVLSTMQIHYSPRIGGEWGFVAPSADGRIVAFRRQAATNAYWNAAVWSQG